MSIVPNKMVSDLSARFPSADDQALEASASDMKSLIDHLASAHDLTIAEAADIIDEWQDGLAIPAKIAAA